MKYYWMAAVGAFALASCGGGATDADADGDGTITQDEVNAAVADVKINPGEWENTVEFVDISFDESKLPAEAREFIGPMLESMKGQKQTMKDCITPEEAEQPAAEMFSGNDAADCEYDRFNFGGGKIDMAMTCSDPGSGTAKITNTGTYTPDEFKMDMSIALQDTEMGQMTISAASTGKRIGECPAD